MRRRSLIFMLQTFISFFSKTLFLGFIVRCLNELRCCKLFRMTTAINHKSCISSYQKNNKQRQQPDDKIRTLRMSTITAKWTILAYFLAASLAVFEKIFIHFSSLLYSFIYMNYYSHRRLKLLQAAMVLYI